jgi:hypothetical protein
MAKPPWRVCIHIVGGSCTCGAVAPDILHLFWQCPVAEGVVALLQAQMPELTRPLHTVHVWMARPPIGWGGTQRGVVGGVSGSFAGNGPGEGAAVQVAEAAGQSRRGAASTTSTLSTAAHASNWQGSAGGLLGPSA